MFSAIEKSPPVYCNATFEDLARLLTTEAERLTYRRELLQPERLDYRVESLKHIDDYLDTVRQDPIPGECLTTLVLRVGAYVGEVIRCRCPDLEYHWLDYEEGARHSDLVLTNGMSLPMAAMLWASDQDMCFPLAQVCKFLKNGREDSLYTFAYLLTIPRHMLVRQVDKRVGNGS